ETGKVQAEPYSGQPDPENSEPSVEPPTLSDLPSLSGESAPEVRPDRPLERSRLIDNLVRSPKRTIPPALCWTPWKLSKPVIPSVDPTTSLAELKVSITESLWLRRVRAILLESHQEIPR